MFLKSTSKTNTRYQRHSLTYFKRKTREHQDSFKLLQKQNKRNPRNFFKLLQKPETRDPRDSFTLLQKAETSGSRDSCKLDNSKTKDKESTRFFQIASKTRQGIPRILKIYLKNQAQGFMRFMQIT